MKSGKIKEVYNKGKFGTLQDLRTGILNDFYNPNLSGVESGEQYEYDELIQRLRGGEDVHVNVLVKKVPTI
tara:strand:- start:76 stop:288 length:213 start_codon:yes stop_codon:yes gene_type:complete